MSGSWYHSQLFMTFIFSLREVWASGPSLCNGVGPGGPPAQSPVHSRALGTLTCRLTIHR